MWKKLSKEIEYKQFSTKDDIVTKEFRVKIKARNELKNDSFAVLNSLCFLHKKYLKQKLSTLTQAEILQIYNALKNLFDR